MPDNRHQLKYKIKSVSFDRELISFGESTKITAHVQVSALRNSKNPDRTISETFEITFKISEYSGIPPSKGGGSRTSLIATQSETAEAELKSGETKFINVVTNWSPNEWRETAPDGVFPEFRAQACYVKNVGPHSKLLKVGDITDVCWEPLGKTATPISGKTAQFWFANSEKVGLRLECVGLNGFLVNFRILQHDDVGANLVKIVQMVVDVPIRNGIAGATWNLTEEMLPEYAFGNFRFEAEVHPPSVDIVYKPKRCKSLNIRHTSSAKILLNMYYVVPDSAFKKAAETVSLQFLKAHTNDRRYIVLSKNFRSESDFVTTWQEITKNIAIYPDGTIIVEGHIFSHASKDSQKDGIEFDPGTLDRSEMANLSALPWGRDGEFFLHGCNTGLSGDRGWTPAQVIAIGQQVKTWGQAGYAYFSRKESTYSAIDDMKRYVGEVYLWAYRRRRNDIDGDGLKMPGILFTQ